MKNIYIQLIDDKGKTTFHNIPLQSTVTIGKTQACDIRVPGKETASMHALLEAFDEDNIFIRSLNSKKKVIVNGKPVDRAKITFSDIVKIGNSEFQIKKVDLHDNYPDSHAIEQLDEETPETDENILKEQSRLERTLKVLTPEEKEKEKSTVEKKKEVEELEELSADEIESSIKIPAETQKEERESAFEPTEKEIEAATEFPKDEVKKVIPDDEELEPPKEPTISRDVTKTSRSLRIKNYWFDILLSDNLYPLINPVTVGSAKKNTYIIPQNGLSKSFSLFIFDNYQPYLVFNKHISGFVTTKEGKNVKLDRISEAYEVAKHRKDSKINLDFEDRGEISTQNFKFEFEFVQTPAPAAIEKPFAKMDKVYRRTLISGLIFLFLFAILAAVTPPVLLHADNDKDEDRIILPGANLGPVVRIIKTPTPRVMKPGGTQGREGEGARASGKEGRRPDKSRQGARGKQAKSQLEIIRDQGIGALMIFKTSNALHNISGGSGGGGDLKRATTTLQAGMPGGKRSGIVGKGTRDLGGTGGGGKTFVGGAGGLGEKGSGLGSKGTGRAPYGTKGEARVTTAEIMEEGIEITGEMDPAIIERLIRNHLGYIKWCYEKQLNVEPELEGKIVIDFIIGIEGRVTASRAKSSTMGNPTVEKCIAQRIRRIKFPSPGGGIVQVFYPFIFRVAGGF